MHGPVGVCPECGSTEIFYDEAMDCSSCQACRWSELPDLVRAYPEDGDKPLLVGPPYDNLYDLYLMAQIDFYNREAENYNNSALASTRPWTSSRKRTTERTCPSPAGAGRGFFERGGARGETSVFHGGGQPQPQADHPFRRGELQPGHPGRGAAESLNLSSMRFPCLSQRRGARPTPPMRGRRGSMPGGSCAWYGAPTSSTTGRWWAR